MRWVCDGVLGGGLMIARTDNGVRRFDLYGVATKNGNGKNCDDNNRMRYTNVLDYKDFIQETIERSNE